MSTTPAPAVKCAAAECLSVLRPCGVAIGCATLWSEVWLIYFDSYATGKRIQHLRKANGMTQEEMAIRLNISDRHLGKIERGEGTASIDLLVEVAVLLKTTLDFLIIGVTETPREKELIAHIKKQNKTIRIFKDELNTLITELTEAEIA